jgi:hypothetical protein
MPMEVLSLYADPIRPALAGRVLRPDRGVGFLCTRQMFLGHNTHCVSWDYRNCQVANSERCLT